MTSSPISKPVSPGSMPERGGWADTLRARWPMVRRRPERFASGARECVSGRAWFRQPRYFTDPRSKRKFEPIRARSGEVVRQAGQAVAVPVRPQNSLRTASLFFSPGRSA